jgi:hypothetical protein
MVYFDSSNSAIVAGSEAQMIAFVIGLAVGLMIGIVAGVASGVRWMEGELRERGIDISVKPPNPYGRIQCGFEDDE